MKNCCGCYSHALWSDRICWQVKLISKVGTRFLSTISLVFKSKNRCNYLKVKIKIGQAHVVFIDFSANRVLSYVNHWTGTKCKYWFVFSALALFCFI